MGTVKYSGPVASFHCPTNTEIRSLKVHFSPKQLGEGDPSPENVRPIIGWDGVVVEKSGNNLWGGSAMKEAIVNNFPVISTDNNIITYSNSGAGQADGAILFSSFKPNTQYTLILTYSKSTNVYTHIAFLYSDGSFTMHSRIAPDDPNTKTTEVYVSKADKTLTAIIRKADEYSNVTLYCDESGLFEGIITKSEYEPYHGSTTNYEFGVLGKNKFNWDVPVSESSPIGSDAATARQFTLDTYVIGMSVNNYYRQNYANWVLNPSVENGVISFSSGGASGYGIAFPLKLAAGQTYFLSGTGNGSAGATYYDENGELISYQNGRLNKTITVPENTVTTLIGFYANTSNTEFTFSNIQLELGSTATAYEPYNPNKTVYGGWVDLITGEVAAEYGLFSYKWENGDRVSNVGNYIRKRFYCPNTTTRIGDPIGNGKNKCNVANWNRNYSSNTLHFYNENNYAYVFLPDGQSDDSDIVMALELTTPIHYSLPSTSLQTFLAQNNVWSNADYVEVEYDLHETQTILARKQFIMANQPHIEKPAAAPLQNFVTDMAAPLKSCKVYFSPVQDTSNGAPSPDNICPISGWTEVEVYRTGRNLFPEALTSDFENYATKGNYGYWYTDPIHLAPNTDYHLDWTRKTSNSDPLCYWGIKTYSGVDYDVTDAGTFQYYCNGANGFRSYASFNSGPTGIIRFALNKQSSQYSTAQDALDDLFAKATFMLTVGTIAIPYESYTGTTLSIDWTTEAGTIYGGYVDLVTGEMWKTYFLHTIDGNSSPNKGSSYYDGQIATARYFWLPAHTPWNSPTVGSTDDAYCDKALSVRTNIWSKPDQNIGAFTLNSFNQLHVIFDNEQIGLTDTSIADRSPYVKNWLADHPMTFVLPLRYPALVATLTPTQLKTLRGTNNIWASNGGDNIELSYWKH